MVRSPEKRYNAHGRIVNRLVLKVDILTLDSTVPSALAVPSFHQGAERTSSREHASHEHSHEHGDGGDCCCLDEHNKNAMHVSHDTSHEHASHEHASHEHASHEHASHEHASHEHASREHGAILLSNIKAGLRAEGGGAKKRAIDDDASPSGPNQTAARQLVTPTRKSYAEAVRC